MNNKVYVGGLPYSVTDARLEEIFTPHGSVASARVIADKFTGQSRGFGFVEMASGDEAAGAIAALNGAQVDGRTLVVNEAKPIQSRDGGASRNGGSRNGAGHGARW
jgi:RNA recognition motif-containing protein